LNTALLKSHYNARPTELEQPNLISFFHTMSFSYMLMNPILTVSTSP
jgi:hypothetical protein